MEENSKDCLNCGESMVTEEDELFCLIKGEVVQDDNYCAEYN